MKSHAHTQGIFSFNGNSQSLLIENQENLSPQKNINEENKIPGVIPENLRQKNPAMEEMRKSVLGPKGAKMKLKLKKGEKADPRKIWAAIDKHESIRNSMISLNSSEYTFTETSYSRNSDIGSTSVIEEESKENLLSKLKDEASGENLINGNSPVKN